MKNADRQMRIGARLHAARVAIGLTSESVANELAVKQGTVLRWEAGESLPNVEMFIDLAVLYGKDPNDLMLDSPKRGYSAIIAINHAMCSFEGRAQCPIMAPCRG